uniref:Uncharacterized protein n=1 Tax=Salix viminalis TaxID=40686 RepID=A0A6N2MBA1_SALVM
MQAQHIYLYRYARVKLTVDRNKRLVLGSVAETARTREGEIRWVRLAEDEGEGGDGRVKEKGRADEFVRWFLQRLKGGTRGAVKVRMREAAL